MKILTVMPLFGALVEPEHERTFSDWQREDDTERWRGRASTSTIPGAGNLGVGQEDGMSKIIGPESVSEKGNVAK